MLTASYLSSAAVVCHNVLALLLAAARLVFCLPEPFAFDGMSWASCGCVACLENLMQPIITQAPGQPRQKSLGSAGRV